MPNLEIPITNMKLGLEYLKENNSLTKFRLSILPLLPCYLTDNLDLEDFEN